MDGDQRHDQSRLRANADDHRGHQRRDDDVVRRRRQAHPKDQRQNRHEKQQNDQVAARDHLDHLTDDLVRAGQRDCADDDARGAGCNADPDHVARAALKPGDKLAEALDQLVRKLAFPSERRFDRAVGYRDDDHHDRRPEGRQRRRQAIQIFGPHHQVPDQYEDRQCEVGAAKKRRRQARRRDGLCVRIINLQVGKSRRYVEQRNIRRRQHHQPGINRLAGHGAFQHCADTDDGESDRRHADEACQKQDHDHHDADVAARFLQPFELQLHRFQVHDVEEGNVGYHRWKEGVFDDFDVGDVDVLHHQKRRRAHHRRRQLTVGGGSDLNRPRFLGRKADPLHQWDGERPRRDGVGDGRT